VYAAALRAGARQACDEGVRRGWTLAPDCPTGLPAVHADELSSPRRIPARERARGAPRAPEARVLEAVLGDRVAGRAALDQPVTQLWRALSERVEVARRDHEQRHAVDAVVGEPGADQRATLERRGLDVVRRDRDAALRARGRDARAGGDALRESWPKRFHAMRFALQRRPICDQAGTIL
jgi:hypothetical protein